MKKILSKTSLFAMLLAGMMIFTPTSAFAGAAGGVTGEITVSCYDSMTYKNYLDYAAKSFEAKNPGTKVNIETFSVLPVPRTVTTDTTSMTVYEYADTPSTPKDYITRVNTEMMSGTGADIYAIDVLPYYKYADSGMFEDLRRFMDSDPDFDYDNYRKNVFDAAMYKDGQYILPLDYSFNCLICDTTLLDSDAIEKLEFGKYTYEQLVELSFDSFISRYNPKAENPIKLFDLSGGIYGTFYSNMLNVNYSSFVDVENKKANFTDGRFAQILNNVDEYMKTGYINTQPVLSFGMPMASPDSLYSLIDNFTLLIALTVDDTVPYLERIVSPNVGSNAITKDVMPIGLLSGSNGESVFTSSQSYAMSSNSKNKDTAWAFLRFLLGDEMQSSINLRCTPVNKNAAAQKAKYTLHSLYTQAGVFEDYFNGQRDGSSTSQADKSKSEETSSEPETADSLDRNMAASSYFDEAEINLTDTGQEIFETYMSYMDQLTPLLNTYKVWDVIINEMIETEVKKFFEGSRTADEVAAVLQNKISMYLQE